MNKFYRKLLGLTLIFLVIWITACEDKAEKEREIRRILSKEILKQFNKTTTQIDLEPENENYIATLKLEDGENMQVIFRGTPEKFQIIETLNSELARKISSLLHVNCISMSLQQIDSLTSKGTGELETGEKLAVFYDRNLGWYPMDKSSLAVVSKYQISENIGVKCSHIELELADSVMYHGKVFVESGDTLAVMVNQKRGWYPVDELTNLLKVTRLQIEGKTKQKIVKITGEPLEKGKYQAKIYSEEGDEGIIDIFHDGTNFTWKLAQ